MTIRKLTDKLTTANKITQLNNMIVELNGYVEQGKFDENEITQIISDLSLDRKFLRNQNIGNTTSTYTNWSHLHAEAGYSIWKYTPTSFTHNTNNKLYMDNEVFEYKGAATSESATSFDLVYLYDGDAASGTIAYTNNSAEAATEAGTEFDLMDTTDDYLYLGEASTFSGIKFEFQTYGSSYTLQLEYWDGSTWSALTANTDDLSDDTSNFLGNGSISWSVPNDWDTSTVNSQTKYWIRISTTSTPTTTAKAYYIIPTSSVIGLLALSTNNILNENWAWCSYNGNIYATIRNTGNTSYEGDYYINSASSDANKKNFFIYNNPFTADYEDSTYSSPADGATGIGFDTSGMTSTNVHDALIEAYNNGGSGASQLSDLTDVNTATVTNKNVLVADGVDWESRALTEADISDLSHYTDSDVDSHLSGGTGIGYSSGTISVNSGLDDIAGLAQSDGNFIVSNGSNWVVESGDTALTSLGLSTNLGDLTDAEVAQLKNIGTETITNTQWGYLGAMSGQPLESVALTDLSDVNTATVTNRYVLVADGVYFESRLLVEADISDLSHYTDSDVDTHLSGGAGITYSTGTISADINGATDLAAPAVGDELLLADVDDSNNIKKSDIDAILTLYDNKTSTLTNKTFDANGTGNSLSNVEVADMSTSAIVTESDAISSNDNDTTLPTSAAVIDYVTGLTTLTTFDNADLSTGVYTFNHALGEQYPHITVYDNNDKIVVPDEVTATDSNNSSVDLSSYGTISGTWRVRGSII